MSLETQHPRSFSLTPLQTGWGAWWGMDSWVWKEDLRFVALTSTTPGLSPFCNPGCEHGVRGEGEGRTREVLPLRTEGACES